MEAVFSQALAAPKISPPRSPLTLRFQGRMRDHKPPASLPVQLADERAQ
jgi:hypothetical protein